MNFKPPRFNFFNKINIPRPMMIWLAGVTSFIAAVEIAWIKNIIQTIYVSDFTKISVLIALILFFQSILCGSELWHQTQRNGTYKDAEETIESGWLWSDIVLSLGMIGTVIGFMMMLAGFVGVDFSDFDSVQALITKLSAGMATSLSTTLVGLIASVILKLQFFGLERIVKKRKNERNIL